MSQNSLRLAALPSKNKKNATTTEHIHIPCTLSKQQLTLVSNKVLNSFTLHQNIIVDKAIDIVLVLLLCPRTKPAAFFYVFAFTDFRA